MSLCFSCALFSLHYPAGSLWLSPCPYSLLCHCWAIVCFCSLARVADLGLQVGASRLQLWGSRLAHLRCCLRLSPLACWDLLLLVAPFSFLFVALCLGLFASAVGLALVCSGALDSSISAAASGCSPSSCLVSRGFAPSPFLGYCSPREYCAFTLWGSCIALLGTVGFLGCLGIARGLDSLACFSLA